MTADLSEQDLELARVAKEEFDKCSYESCLSVLKKLQESRRQDASVAHNIALTQYHWSKLTCTDEFRRSLHSVRSQVRAAVPIMCG